MSAEAFETEIFCPAGRNINAWHSFFFFFFLIDNDNFLISSQSLMYMMSENIVAALDLLI